MTWTTSTRTLMTLVLVVTKRGMRVKEVMGTMKNKNIWQIKAVQLLLLV